MISIEEIRQKDLWQDFFFRYPESNLPHDWVWGEVQEKFFGRKIFRLGIFRGGALTGICLALIFRSRIGECYLHVPHGPLCNSNDKEALDALIVKLRNVANIERAQAIRISPIWEDSDSLRALFSERGFRTSEIFLQPENEVIVSLSGTEEEIFSRMRKTTRQEIRAGERAGVTVLASEDPADLEKFLALHRETEKRQGFYSPSKQYIRALVAAFAAEGRAKVFLGVLDGNPVSGAVVLFTQNSAFYLYGASASSERGRGAAGNDGIPKAHIVQWEIAKEAKRRGCLFYNLHAVAGTNNPRHPWRGLSLFKEGFGGAARRYAPSQYLMTSPRFAVTLAIEYLVALRRGFRS